MNRSRRPHSFSSTYSRVEARKSDSSPLIRQFVCSALCSELAELLEPAPGRPIAPLAWERFQPETKVSSQEVPL